MNDSVDSPDKTALSSTKSTNQDTGKDRYLKTKDRNKASDASESIRQPIQQYSINSSPSQRDDETQALLSRYKYYSNLDPQCNSSLQMPDHIVPGNYWVDILVPVAGKQSSIITIFALWNTMMGTSILSMPWAIQQAGFVTGLVLLLFMAGLMLYTSYRILKSVEGVDDTAEFSDVCRHYLGRWAEIVAIVCSFLTLLGGAIVYWILLSNFLFNVVSFIHYRIETHNQSTPITNRSLFPDAICPSPPQFSNKTLELSHSMFSTVWDEQKTVPFFLIIVLFPLLNFKSPTFFTKFNSLGTISVAYLMCFVAVKVSNWNLNVDFNPEHSHEPDFVENFKSTFPALTGISALAYFVQNCCLAICRNQKHPENNVRDLSIAYTLVCITYVYVGIMFYAAFPLPKSCIEDNLLNNIASTDVMAFVARIGLFFQMMTVFPLLLYILRIQLFSAVWKNIWPSWRHVAILNITLVSICLLFAIFEPHIGKIIGFVGAFCGFAYAIALPCLVYMCACREGGKLTWIKIIFHSILIALGFANVIGQFLIIGHVT